MMESPLPTSAQSTPSLSHDPLGLDTTTHRAIVDALRQQNSPCSRPGATQFNTFSPVTKTLKQSDTTSSRGVKLTNSPGSRGVKPTHSPGPRASENSSADGELLVSMAQRLGMVEKELLQSKREIVQKVSYGGVKYSEISDKGYSQREDKPPNKVKKNPKVLHQCMHSCKVT